MKIRGIKSFCRKNRIELFVLFGSSAGDEPENANDIDVAVKFKKGTSVPKLQLIYMLDDLFSGKKIDLVVLSADTDPLLTYEIYKGKCLYEIKAGIFENEKLRAWKLYLDTEKIRNMRSEYLTKFTKKVSHVA